MPLFSLFQRSSASLRCFPKAGEFFLGKYKKGHGKEKYTKNFWVNSLAFFFNILYIVFVFYLTS